MGYTLKFSKYALKDAKKLEECGLDKKAIEILKILKKDPYQNPPSFERLKGDLQGKLSRRINIQHRIIYEVLEHEHVVKIYRMWTHYE